ncbi:MAG TPA: hypothetical protein VJM31_04975 [Vicinamibacterales bacterium]|nr:hypothetical protein [Vicinamibacterales bacterium]
MRLKRLRGALLRMVLKRTVAIALGVILLIPAAWLLVQDFSWETAATDGLGLIVGATGAALLFAGIGGRRPDWQD